MNHTHIRNQIFIWILLLGSVSAYSQVKNDFEPRYKDNLRGEITFIANNIVNRQQDGYWTWKKVNGEWENVWVPPISPNDPYNSTGSSSKNNDDLNMQYIDVDNDDSTFSSSSATLSVPEPNCSKIRYAGLYWSATYKYNKGNTSSSGRHNDYNQVKFKTPDGDYIGLTADEILFDGINDADFGYYGPYACYKDVTSIVAALPNPDGDYFVANVRASNGGGFSGGISGGWTMVVVYENPNLPGKFITTFDGYAGIKSGKTLDIPINGFTTLPNPFPVKAKIGVATLEGDNKISGDGLSIKANSNSTYTALGNTVNPKKNFFNANITLEDNIVMSRNPNSINTLGWDVDMFTISNPLNKTIPNNETGATLRASSSQDKYDIFFTSFDIEIIEPEIVLEKKVEDTAGNDITGMGVNLGQTLDYVLNFRNTGNDDAVNYTIKDVLPVNVTLDESNFTLPSGVSYTYDPATRTVVFSIPDDLVNKGDPTYSIRMRVNVATNCFDFVDACSDKIENLAYSTYKGLLNDNEITEDPSIYDFNDCGFVVPGATNFLLDDLSDCSFARTVQLCGDNVLLDAGNGFDAYIWYKDVNGNGVVDASDTVLNDGDPDNDPSTISVTDVGTYIVDKQVADPCKGFKEIIKVERFGATQTNPIIDFFNSVNSDADPSNDIQGEIVSCSIDGDLLPKIFLCGTNASELIQVNVTDALSIVWEQLNEGSCTASGDDCGNKNGTCTWSQVATGKVYNASTEGQFRLVLNYQNGCSSRFYFNVFQNNLDIIPRSNDIICNTPGNITITNLGNGYGYQLYDAANNTVVVPFNANNGPSFDITTKGSYRVDVVQLDSSGVPIDGSCIFSTPNIGIRDRDFKVDITPVTANCHEGGKINIQALNAEPNYSYELRLDDGSNGGQGTLVDDETAQADNNFTFNNLNPGNYIVLTKTDDGCTDTQNIVVGKVPDLTLAALTIANIGCSDGTIRLTAGGGFINSNYAYAIWSKNGTPLYADINDIPASEYQAERDFIFTTGEGGDYTFVVVDANNCYKESNKVTIEDKGTMDFTPTSTPIVCSGSSTASLTITVTGGVGPFNYSIDDGDTTQTTNKFVNLAAGDYTVRVTDASGCDVTKIHTIIAPDVLTAVATVLEAVDCNTPKKAAVEIGSVQGGVAPYTYSFDGGANFGPANTAMLTPGTHNLLIKDASGCSYPMSVIVANPVINPSFSYTVYYNCDGTGKITVTSDNTTDFDYTYEIDGSPNTPSTSDIFGSIGTGSHNITISYSTKTNPFPTVCTLTKDILAVVESGKAFEANLLTYSNPTCSGLLDGSIKFEVGNFDTATGFEYSVNGGAFTTSLTSPVTVSAGLVLGTNSIEIRKVDDTGCTTTLTQDLTAPTAVVASAAITTQLTCTNGGATITASATGGSPGYQYQLEDNAGNIIPGFDYATNGANRIFAALAAGDYIVRARDTNTCEDVIDNAITVNVPTAITFTAVPTACYSGNNDGSIKVDVTGGNGNLLFSLNGGPYVAPSPATASTYTFENLGSGSYTIDVKDGFGCPGTQQTVVIAPKLNVTATAKAITACATDTDVTITASGGDSNFVYAIVGNGIAPQNSDFHASNTIAVTSAGDYDVYVRDHNGNSGYCQTLYDINIIQNAAIVLSANHTDVMCSGNNTGSISMSATGGTGVYIYSIDGGTTYHSSGNFTNLAANTYNVIVKDSDNCETPDTVIIAEPAALDAAASASAYTCTAEAQITVDNVTGGSGTYQYRVDGETSWLPSGGTTSTTYAFTQTFTDGNYTVQARDFNSPTCSFDIPVTIAPLPVKPTLASSIAYNCEGTGNITITPNDPSYTYAIDGNPAQPSNQFTNIAAGSHTVVVDYGSGCTTSIDVVVASGKAFTASIISTKNITCFGDVNGEIALTAKNFGVGGYEYRIGGSGAYSGPFTTDQAITGLTAQAYVIEVRDVDNPAGCTVALNQTLTQPNAIVASAIVTAPFTCNNTGATITASAVGGTPTYTYSIDGGANYQTSPIFTNVGAGTYTIIAKDANGCEDPIDSTIPVVAPKVPVFTATTACYSGNNDGSIDVTVTDGNNNYQFSINGGPWMTPTPANATTYTFANLTNGSYTIDVKDSYGCAAQETAVINAQLTATINVTDISICADGSITVNATGGDGNLQYAYVPTTTDPSGSFTSSNTFAVTPGNDGSYDVYVRDDNASAPYCEYKETVTVNPATPLVFTAIGTDPQCHDEKGSVALSITSGTAPFKVELLDINGIPLQTINNFTGITKTFYNLNAADYQIRITDAKGCPVMSATATITNPDELIADIGGVTPAACTGDPNDFGFKFTNYPGALGSIEFSADGGTTWGTNDVITGYVSGSTVNPSMRTVDGLGNTLCQTDFPPFIIPYPLDDLDITIAAIVVGCNELQVTVQGTAGVPNYEYAYSDNPAAFNPLTAAWTASTPGNHVWTNLIPGRTYVFYVRDNSGCVRQSSVNVNNIITPPMTISAVYEPSCAGANDAEITYTITDQDGTYEPLLRWELYNVATSAIVQSSVGSVPYSSPQNITITGLAPSEYYFVAYEVDGGGVDSCLGASENLRVEELKPITGTPNVLEDITCANPGLIEIQNPAGGGGTYTYTLSSANLTSPIVTTNNPIEINISDLVDATLTSFNVNVSVVDQFGCPEDLGNVTINVAQKPTIDAIVVNNCVTPFSITVTVSGGVGPYLYSIDGGANYVGNGGVFNNVAIGSYNISIIDSNGCSDATVVATEVYPVLQANASITKLLDCSATPNANITIKATDGSGSYDYEITGPVNQLRTNLPSPANELVWSLANVAGTYTVSVYDNNTPTCPPRTFTVEVEAALTPQFTAVPTDISCNAAIDGTITVNATDNGTSPYAFQITALDGSAASINPTSSTSTTATFTGLAPSTTASGYVVTATGANGCTTDVSNIVISEPAVIAVTLDPVVEFVCTVGNTDNNATISVASAIGGSGTYVRYEFINTTTSTTVQDGSNSSYTETDTAGGSYTINVYDDKGCMGTATTTITPFVTLTDVTATPTDPTCNPGGDGQVQVDVTLAPGLGGTNLQYDIDGTDFVYNATFSGNTDTHIFTGLAIGKYLITVTNTDTNCVVQTTAELQNPNTFDIDIDVTSDVVCFGSSTGAAQFSITDASYLAGFDYQVFEQVTNTQMTGVLNQPNLGPSTAVSLPAGDYYVVITEDSNPFCENRKDFSIDGPTAAITANAKVTPITCNPTDNGIIEITDAIGGWGGYMYYVGTSAPSGAGDYGTSPKFENLSAGTYEVWIIDQNGCALQLPSETLSDPTPITADLQVNAENCSNFDGIIEVTNMLGGQGSNYSYQLQKYDGSSFVDERSVQTSTIFSGLGAGRYQVIVSDQWGCSAVTANTIELYDDIIPLATIVKAIDCTVDPGGQITISQTGGSGTYAYDVLFPDGTTVDNNIDGIFTGLYQFGEYTFTITDGTCSQVIKKSLEPRVEPILNIDSFTNVTCSGDTDGTITVTATDNGVGPYTFEITVIDGTVSAIAPTSNTSTSATFTGLNGSIGGTTYTITTTAANACTTTIDQILTIPVAIANINASVVEFGCSLGNNPNNATITIDASAISGGSGNYVRYEFINAGVTVQNGASPKYVETDLLGGTYTINVYDDKGCSGTTTATIAPFIKISDPMVTSVVDVTCNGLDAEIQVGVTTTGGTPNLEYTVTGVGNAYTQTTTSTNNPETFTGLGVGNYNISITNTDTGCIVGTSYEIKEPNIIEAVATKVTDEMCLNDGTDDGSFEVAISNYAGNYSYQVYDINDVAVLGQLGTGNAGTALTISGLTGGSYYVEITETNAPFCVTTSNAVTIIAPQAPITATISEEANVSCTDDLGAILVDPEGGVGPYTILLSNTTTGNAYNSTLAEAYLFEGLSAGVYDVIVTDANGCEFRDNITLVAPTPIVASISPDVILTCYGDDDGVISATVSSGGFGTIQYQLNVYDPTGAVIMETSALQTSNAFTDLPAGIYSITVVDNGNCGMETAKMTISDPTDVQGLLVRTSPLTCMTQADLLLTATGGTGPYLYSIDGTTFIPMAGGNTQTFSVGAGTYQYYIRDSFNCTSILSNAISEDAIEPLTLDVDEAAAVVNCNGESSAAIYAKADGGLGNYQYQLFSDAALTQSVAGPKATGNFKDLVAGDYYVQVTSVDCTLSSNVIHIVEPTPLSVTDHFIDITCNGAKDGSITVELSGGSGGYQYAISPNLNKFDSVNTFSNLAPGAYTVIAQDKNGCFVVLDYTLTEPTVLDITSTITPEICAGSEDGTIILAISGGTAPYSTSLNSNNAGDYVQNQMDFSGLAAGTYVVFIKDAHGCESNIVVDITHGVNLNATVEPVYECTGDTPDNHLLVTLEDNTVAADVMYALDSTDPNDMQLDASFTNIAPGTHYLAIAHANGCIKTIDFTIESFDPLTLMLQQNNINEITAVATGGKIDYTFHFGDVNKENDNTFIINKTGTYTVTVTDKNGCQVSADIFMEFIDIEIPNFFTPDGDGNNDLWKPKNLEAFPNILMTIFDRYGREIYRMGANDPGWKGMYQESELPSGDYWYIIKLNGETDTREFIGHFTLYR